jgi:chemotaxis protein histidine kinase CheA
MVSPDCPEGGTVVDQIRNMMDQLSELSDEQIIELQSDIISEFEMVEGEEPTPQTVEAMTSLADMLDSVRSEVKNREVQAKELAQQATEATARVRGEEASVEENIDEAAVSEAATEQPKEDNMENEKEMPVAPEEPVAPTEETTPDAEAAQAEDAEKVGDETPEEDKKDDEEEEPVMASAEESAVEETASVEEVIELSTEDPEVIEEAPAAEEAPVVEAELAVEETVELSTEESIETPDVPVAQEEIVEAPLTADAFDAQDVTPEVPADRRPSSMTSAIPVAITAGADIPGVTAGTELSNMSDVADAFAKRLHGLRRVNGGDGEQHIVASFSTQYPEAFQLGTDAEANMTKINEAVAPAALTASGSYQSPFATRYEVFGVGSNVRPIRDAFPSFQADRGGIRYITPPALSAYGSAVGVWTTALDTAYASGTSVTSATKDNLVVAAAAETTAVADAVTLQMQFGNLATRAYPELIARHNELGLIQHAREAEQNILAKLTSASTAVTSTSVLGLGVDFLLQIGRAAALYRARHRMEDGAVLRVIAPSWIKSAIQADFALQMPGDSAVALSDGDIEGYLRARGVNITFHLDDSGATGAQSGGAFAEFPDTFTWYMFAEGSFLFLDGGTLDLGVIRDSTLVGTNDYKMFVETFEGLAFVGVESLKVVSTISVNGARAALRDTLGATTATTIEF